MKTKEAANSASWRQCATQAFIAEQPPSTGFAATMRERGNATEARLTPRQVEVLALLCEGLPNKLICRRLNISPETVKAHISSVLRELGVSSRLQAVVFATRGGLAVESAVPVDTRADHYFVGNAVRPRHIASSS
jgi:DNA-binding NarL/FixJ family response regulator